MKKTITFGLLIFFVGLLMTACGSDDSSPAPAPTTTPDQATINGLPMPTNVSTVPTTTCGNTGQAACGQQYSMKLYLTTTDANAKPAFAAMVGVQNGGNAAFNNLNLFDGNMQPEGQFLTQCLIGIGIPALINWASNGAINTQGGCFGQTQTTTTNGVVTNTGTISDVYNMVLSPQTGNVYSGVIQGHAFNYSFRATFNPTTRIWEDHSKNPAFGIEILSGVPHIVTMYNGQKIAVGRIAN